MNAVFADTFYFLALLNALDEAHESAEQFAADATTRFVTTAWVLTELADGLADTAGRRIFPMLLERLASDPRVEMVPADDAVWRRAVELYTKRPDKEWSLTDCLSFVVMSERGITDALTADHHFKQAGFNALLMP
jgi:uncharacterized protein